MVLGNYRNFIFFTVGICSGLPALGADDNIKENLDKKETPKIEKFIEKDASFVITTKETIEPKNNNEKLSGNSTETPKEEIEPKENSEYEPFVTFKLGYQYGDDYLYTSDAPNTGLIGISGGLHFNKSWSWDIGYQHGGEFYADATNIRVSTSLFDTALRYDFPITDETTLYGRAGVAYWNMDKTRSNGQELNSRGFSPLGEVGIDMSLSKNISMSLGYQYIDEIGDTVTGAYDGHSVVMGLTYHFRNPPAPVAPQKVFMMSDMEYKNVFEFDNAKLQPGAKKVLQIVATYLKRYPEAEIQVIGHTDFIGSIAYNQKLSKERAMAVVAYLTRLGVEPSRMTSKGEGELKPIASNATPEGRAKNRRVEMIIPSFTYQDKVADLKAGNR